MKWFAYLLLIGVMFRHFTHDWLGSQTYLGPKGWFYMMGGIWEIFLCSALFMVVWNQTKTIWRWVALYALGIGICAATQIAVCRALVFDISKVKGNTCDFITGMPVTSTFNVLCLMVGAILLGVMWRESNYK